MVKDKHLDSGRGLLSVRKNMTPKVLSKACRNALFNTLVFRSPYRRSEHTYVFHYACTSA